MADEKSRTRPKRSGVEFQEERAWVGFYRRVSADVAIATEVLAQLEADPNAKSAHLALYLCCKQSLRMHKARQVRNKRIGQFVRGLCQALFVAPARALRHALGRGGDIAVECLPETRKEPATPKVRRLTQDPEFAQAQSAFVQAAPAASDKSGVPTSEPVEATSSSSSKTVAKAV